MSAYFVGSTPGDSIGDSSVRYFYALRRTDDGLVYFAKIDNLQDEDAVIINNPGFTDDDFPDFEYGVDFFDGRSEEDRSRPYANLQWDQYRWDNRSLFYYINEQGEFVVRINQAYNYPPDAIVE